MGNNISFISIVFSLSSALAVIFLLLSIFLFFYHHIMDVYLDLSGRRRIEAVKKKRESLTKLRKYVFFMIVTTSVMMTSGVIKAYAVDGETELYDPETMEIPAEEESEIIVEKYDLEMEYNDTLISVSFEPFQEYSMDDDGRGRVSSGVYRLTAEVIDDHYHISRISINDEAEVYTSNNDDHIEKNDIQISGDTHICIEAEKDSYDVYIKGLAIDTLTSPAIRRKPAAVIYNSEEISVSDDGAAYIEDVLFEDEIFITAEEGFKISRNNSIPSDILTISMTYSDARDHTEEDPIEIKISAIERDIIFHDGLTGHDRSHAVSVLSDNVDIMEYVPSEETAGYSFAGWYYNDGISDNTVSVRNGNTKGTIIETLDNKDPIDGDKKLFTSETENRTIDLYAIYTIDGNLSITAEGPVRAGGESVKVSSDMMSDGSKLWFSDDVVLTFHAGDNEDDIIYLYSVKEISPDGSSIIKNGKSDTCNITLSLDDGQARIAEYELTDAYIEKTVNNVVCTFHSSFEREASFTVRQDACSPKVLSLKLDLPASSRWGILPYGNFFNKDAVITVSVLDIYSSHGLDSSDKDAVNSGLSGISLLIKNASGTNRVSGETASNGKVSFKIPSDFMSTDSGHIDSYSGNITVFAVDKVGNETECKPDAIPEKNIESSLVHYETIKPFTQLMIDGKPYSDKTVNMDSEYWIRKDSVLRLVIRDDDKGPEKNSGLYFTEYDINGKRYKYDSYDAGSVYKDESIFEYMDDDLINGRNELRVKVYDLAGNVSNEDTYTFYRDIYVPAAKLTVNNKDYTDNGVTYHDGGYWLIKDTDLRLDISDLGYEGKETGSAVSSGLKALSVTIQNISDTEPQLLYSKTYEASGKAIYETSYIFKYKDLKEGKNNVYVKAVDWAGNSLSRNFTFFSDKHIPEVTSLQVSGLTGSLSYGAFANTSVTVKVKVKDRKYTSGINTIRFVYHYTEKYDKKYEKTYKYEENDIDKAKTSGDNSEVFTIALKADDLMNTKGYFTVYLEDNAGNGKNYSDIGSAGEGFGVCNLKKNLITIENRKPVIFMKTEDPEYIDKRVKDPNKKPVSWYSSCDVKFDYSITDSVDERPCSGISKMTISVNGKRLRNTGYYVETEKIRKRGRGSFNLKEAGNLHNNGSNTVVVAVRDSAGNFTSEKYYVYIDTRKPTTAGITFKGKNGKRIEEQTVYSVKTSDYCCFCNEDTEATVFAEDQNASSGIDTVCFLKKDTNKKLSDEKKVIDTESNIHTGKKTSGIAVFKIRKNFKGQVYAQAVDHAGNYQTMGQIIDGYKGRWCHAGGFIVESKTFHESAGPHIRIEPLNSPAAYTDGAETPLYKDSAQLKITVMDTYSGILATRISVKAPFDTEKNYEETAEADLNGNISEGWKINSRDINLVTEMTKTITVDNNSNDIVVHVDMTDRCGNTSEEEFMLSIDRDPPEISVSSDLPAGSDDNEWTGYFNQDRTFTITVKERNFDPSLIRINASKDGKPLSIGSDFTGGYLSDPKESQCGIYSMKYTFSAADSDYMFSVTGTDMASNETIEEKVDYGSASDMIVAEKFTIDQTKPEIVFDMKGDMGQEGYYQGSVTGIVTVIERNFDSGRFNAVIEVYDCLSGEELSHDIPVQWKEDDADQHTGFFIFDSENRYVISSIRITDKAGNDSEVYNGPEFTVDMSQPEIDFYTDQTMEEELDHTARSGSVTPFIAVNDTNYDRLEWTLSGYRHKKADKTDYPAVYAEALSEKSITTGTVQFEDFRRDEYYDDVYTLTVTAYDKSGRITGPESVIFSVNRFGSTYMLDTETKKLNEKYYISQEQAVTIMEINAVPLDEDNTRVSVSCNGETRVLEPDRDYIVKKTVPCEYDKTSKSTKWSESRWYEYTYIIDERNFAAEGRYNVDILTSDKNDDDANIQSNEASKHDINMFEGEISGFVAADEDNSASAPVEFVVDKTAPNLVMMDLDPQYMESSLDVTITCTDAGRLKEVIYTVDEVSEVILASEFEKNGGNVVRTLRSGNKKQKIRLSAADMAGNISYYPAEGNEISVQITRNLFYLLINNTFAMVLSVLSLLGAAGSFVIFIRKYKERS